MILKYAVKLLLLCFISQSIHAQNYYGKTKEVALTSIKPQGWIKEFLQRQADGLSGSPSVSGYPYNTNMWMEDIHIPVGHVGKDLWPYEQTAYYLDGSLRCGYLIGDKKLIDYTQKNINYTLNNVDETGILGQPKADDWARVVYFRGMMADYDVTHNKDIISKMSKHFLDSPRLFNEGRGLMSIEPILWLYNKTGNEKLLELAKNSIHNIKNTSLGGEYKINEIDNELSSKMLDRMLSNKKPGGHGVGFVEQAKLPAILYLYTGEQKYLDATINAINKLEKHHFLVDGVQSSVEHLSGKSINMAHETCDIIDLSWSLGYLLMATNDGHWGDLIERAIFNAGLGALDKNFKAHQYYSAPNQPVAAEETSQFNMDKDWGGMALGRMCYRTGHDTECCTGNIHRLMPVYVGRMWLENADNSGVTAALYGASDFTFKKNHEEIKIQQKTNYPFDENIRFTFHMNQKANFSFGMRIPAWCTKPEIKVNGKTLKKFVIEQGMAKIQRNFSNGDQIELHLPMEMKLTTWGTENEGVAVERGPLVYSLNVENKSIKFPFIGNPKLINFPNKLMYPTSDWNYALNVKDISDAKFIQINADETKYPWDLENTPVKIEIPAKKVMNWNIEGTHHAPSFPKELTLDKQEKVITLVPLGTTYLRMTVFPKTK
ncbi:beta-L-arabinofuranosidase domain-containing protein [Polaribacter sp. Q13]|uniref:beta-L-arabinofuranosidase domain-containing protein n=1 Tax=Polaribacter sp. Q13 TaxID=2806551 RepID=UPI00193C3CFD|nr:beta-L-arabinofuranosidase domain-containing protein [Polaribacter sp. Q13]QVY66081.1 glycoside hydrolase family 127 protein [Polaribacter sp. Q13]